MIIFDLSCLADDSHRRHFIDVHKSKEKGIAYEDVYCNIGGIQSNGWFLEDDPDRRWKPDYEAYYAAIDQDQAIYPSIEIFRNCKLKFGEKPDVRIWSDRCDSVRHKTEQWLRENICGCAWFKDDADLKMRPIGDDRPAEQLFEQWLDEYMVYPKVDEMKEGVEYRRNDLPEMAFIAHPAVIALFRLRGIFTFDCRQEV